MKNIVERLRKELADPQAIRRMVQWGFALLTVWIGIKFILFVHQAGGEGEITLTRPPGVEAKWRLTSFSSIRPCRARRGRLNARSGASPTPKCRLHVSPPT